MQFFHYARDLCAYESRYSTKLITELVSCLCVRQYSWFAIGHINSTTFYLIYNIVCFQAGLTFRCDSCPKTFSHRHSMRAHQLAAHARDVGTNACSECCAVFRRTTDLEKHRHVHVRIVSETRASAAKTANL